MAYRIASPQHRSDGKSTILLPTQFAFVPPKAEFSPQGRDKPLVTYNCPDTQKYSISQVGKGAKIDGDVVLEHFYDSPMLIIYFRV